MFERFTQRAREIVVGAKAEAALAGIGYIGTEHLLASMLTIGDGTAYEALHAAGVTVEFVRAETARIVGNPGPLGAEDAAALKTIGIDLDAVLESVERSFGPGALSEFGHSRRSHHIPFTRRGKKALELALREALRLGDNYIGTEHLLLGLIREGDGVATQVLVNAGVDLTAMRAGLAAARGGDRETVPGTMFGTPRLTPAAREVLTTAGEEARRWDARCHLGTEQLLFALADAGSGPAFDVLVGAGLTADAIRAAILAADPAHAARFSEWRWTRGRSRLTSGAKKALEQALREATKRGAGQISPEHLLFGILADPHEAATRIVEQAGVTPAELLANLATGLDEAA